jgi:hypothetical protein
VANWPTLSKEMDETRAMSWYGARSPSCLVAPLLVSRTVSESEAASVTHSSAVCVGCQASAVGCESGTFWKGTTVRASPSAAAHPAAVAETETGGDGDGGGGDGDGGDGDGGGGDGGDGGGSGSGGEGGAGGVDAAVMVTF